MRQVRQKKLEKRQCKIVAEGLELCFQKMKAGEQPNFLEVMAAINSVTNIIGPNAGCLDCR